MKVTQLFKGLKTEQKIEQKQFKRNRNHTNNKKGWTPKKLYLTFSWFSKID